MLMIELLALASERRESIVDVTDEEKPKPTLMPDESCPSLIMNSPGFRK